MVKERIFILANKSFKNNPRYEAMQILNQVLNGGGYSNILINQCLSQQQLTTADQHLLVNLVYGVLQHKLTLDYFLEKYLQRQKHLQSWVQNLLRLSVYQMYYLDRIPDRAIFFEATQIAKAIGGQKVAGLITAVLRNLQRDGWRSLTELSPLEHLSITASVPTWIIQSLKQQVGWQKTEKILTSLNQPPQISVRVNTNKITPKQLQTELEHDGFQVHPSQVSPGGLIIDKGSIIDSPWFQAGYCTMQDESSMLVAPALQVQKGMNILDACAAPGGKTTHIATYLNNSQEQITALDLHAQKLRLIEQNARRLGVQQYITTKALDARQAGQEFSPQSFQRILVDAPCSGLGLLRRKPEIRYAKKAADLQQLAQIQLAILEAVAPLVALQGILLYSTCTILAPENQQVVAKFLKRNPEFSIIPVVTDWPLTQVHRGHFIQIYPDDYQTDGFFIAALQKQSSTQVHQ